MDYDTLLMRKAIELATISVEHFNQPFGSLLAKNDGTIILTAENTELTEDPTCHAEMNLVRKIYRNNISEKELVNMTLYTSTEPCVMCTGAIFKSKIGRIVYGCSSETLSKIAHGGSLPISCCDIFSRGKRHISVKGPFLEEEASNIHLKYWPTK